MAKLWHVYVIEVDGEIIYVGCTSAMASRRSYHRARKLLPRDGGEMRSVQTFKTQAAALKAELALIRKLRPRFNMVGNPSGFASRDEQSMAIYEAHWARESAKWRDVIADVQRDMAEHPERYEQWMKPRETRKS